MAEKNTMSAKERSRLRMKSLPRAERSYIRRRNAADRLWRFFRFLILFGLGFIILYPLLYMISCTFRDRSDMTDPTVLWIPRHPTLSVLKDTIEAMDFWNALRNTLVINVGCSFMQVASCALTGYGFARFSFRGKKLLFGIVILMMLVPTQIISLPLFFQFRFFGIKGVFSRNLIDSVWTMYLPAMTANGIRSGLMILIFRQFFRGLPRELEDAAYIDGCGPFMTFVRVMIPNAIPAFLTVFLFSIVWYWNDYYVSTMFFHNTRTVSTMLYNLDSELSLRMFGDATIKMSPREQIVWKQASCLLSITPLLILYTFLQKYFTEGIERSGLVG
ncbi:MAG: carbohydrate ABC transporter permease [Ruminococcus sp.]|nr:carbohydrate ABC transporter permease [Ruminococcus sp.]